MIIYMIEFKYTYADKHNELKLKSACINTLTKSKHTKICMKISIFDFSHKITIYTFKYSNISIF